MSVFIDKYKKQFKAMRADYDVPFEMSADYPITFEDKDNIRLSLACIADTHLVDKDALSVNLHNFFCDVLNAERNIDAALIAGDISEYGKNAEYNRFFAVSDEYKDKCKIFLTMGNHDVRFQYGKNQKIIMNKVNEYLDINTNGKSYYSYDINGYTIIVIGTEKRVLEKAHITEEQMAFLDSELKRATKDGKPAFVMCHQAFAFTHGLPEVWKTGDMGEQSHKVRAIMEKHKNVFFINGHLHGGIFEKTFEVLNEENNVHSISIPGYRKENNFGIMLSGTGCMCEVYDDKVVFVARRFLTGEPVEGEYTKVEYKLI